MAEVPTPNGLRDEGSIRKLRANGSVRGAGGEASPPRGARPTFADGWVMCSYWGNDTGQPVTHFGATITVPKAPVARADPLQWIFLFSGAENAGVGAGILQPVLAWGPSRAHADGYGWSISSWYAPFVGDAAQSPVVAVNPGDVLRGTIKHLRSKDGLFDYASEWEGYPVTRLRALGIPELGWYCTALEQYGVTVCDHYPDARKCSFDAITLRLLKKPAPLTWTLGQPATPECGLRVEAKTAKRVDYWFR